MSALRPLRSTKMPGVAGVGVGIWGLYRAKTLGMSAELVFSCGHKPALRYSLISPWTS
jgi:hypothetical protein